MEIQQTTRTIRTVGIDELAYPARININLSVEGDALRLVEQLNAMAVDGVGSEIDFRSGFALPHITLLMGETDDDVELREIIAETSDFFKAQPPMPYELSDPYRKGKGYVFLDLIPQDSFRVLRKELHLRIGDMLDCELHGGPTNVSHITLAYVTDNNFDIDLLRSTVREQTTGVADRVQVGEVGPRGTCRRLILPERAEI